MRERLINRRQQGDLGEVSAIEWLTRQGALVSAPFGHSPHYDLIADMHGRLVRVQVKTCTRFDVTPNGHSRWSVLICTNGGNQSWTGTTKRFDPTTVDALFVVVGDGRRWFIPAEVVEAHRAVTLGGSKYSEFEIDRTDPILPLIYGPDEQNTRIEPDQRGSVEVGESSGPVKSVPMAEWVRIPPPPSLPLELPQSDVPPKFRRTRMSSGHQVTIPRHPFSEAHLEVGDRFDVTADGTGRVILERIQPAPDTLPLDGLDPPTT